MKIFSFDAETNGLWGQAFAIGALVYEDGREVARFVARLPSSVVTDDWWNSPEEGEESTRLSKLVDSTEETHQDYKTMLEAFAAFYMDHKDGADIVVHMGVPVEASLLRDMHDGGFIGDWDGPFPLLDVAGMLKQAGEDPISVDAYASAKGLEVGEFAGGTHNPLYDSAVTAAVYQHLLANR